MHRRYNLRAAAGSSVGPNLHRMGSAVTSGRKSARHSLEACPNCRYTLSRRSTWCPYCGVQLTHPPWKKVGAWILLVLIVYGLVQCHLRLLEGPNGLNSLP